VLRDWIEEGSVIEFELPRHLTCRACEGGGCDTCDRSGAVTLRDRGEPPDLVEVTLPSRPENESFVIRIPERGGLASEESGLPRGQLFLRIEAVDSEPSASVSKVVPVSTIRRVSHEPAAPTWYHGWLVPVALGVVVALCTAAWLLLRSR